jgi:2-polyprenyl-3-methyl-5-hydroxy-6-metoxy-1,4-benzoquinol methylase
MINKDNLCRICGSRHLLNFGVLPRLNKFAGQDLNYELPKTSLYKCLDCLLVFRNPVLSVCEYNSLYQQADSSVWSNGNQVLRYDQSLVIDIISKSNHYSGKVLDVGCYTGELLKALPEGFIKYGVEMSERAAKVASSYGISILSDNLYELNTSLKFDFILAVDVIEHTHNPEAFILTLVEMLSSGGKLVISTGNTDSWLWRLLKSKFWYCKYPEHISFIGIKWLIKFTLRKNLKLSEIHIFNYTNNSFFKYHKSFVKTLFAVLRIKPERYSNGTKDHMCFVIEKT